MRGGWDRWEDDDQDQVGELLSPDLVPGATAGGTAYRYRRGVRTLLAWVLPGAFALAWASVLGWRELPRPVAVLVLALALLGCAVVEGYAYWVVQADRNGVLLMGPLRVRSLPWPDVAWQVRGSGPFRARRSRTEEQWVLAHADGRRTRLPQGFRGSELDRWRAELGGAQPWRVPPR